MSVEKFFSRALRAIVSNLDLHAQQPAHFQEITMLINPKSLSNTMRVSQDELNKTGHFGLVFESSPFSEEICISSFDYDGKTEDYPDQNSVFKKEIESKYTELSHISPELIITVNKNTMLITKNEETTTECVLMVNSDSRGASCIGPEINLVDLDDLMSSQGLLKNGDRQAVSPPPATFLENGDKSHEMGHIAEIDVSQLIDDTDLNACASEWDKNAKKLLIDVFNNKDDVHLATLSVEQVDHETGQRYRSLRQSQFLSRPVS